MGEKKEESCELSPKRERFCREYVIDHNGTQAAIRAGYSEKTAGSQAERLLKKVEVQSRIAELEKDIAKTLEIDAQWVLRRSVELVERCMQRVPVTEFDYENKEVVQKIDPETGMGIWSFDSRGANAALDRIARYTGGFSDRIDHTTKGEKITGEEYTDEEKAAIALALRKKRGGDDAAADQN